MASKQIQITSPVSRLTCVLVKSAWRLAVGFVALLHCATAQTAVAAPDTLVVCPSEFRGALEEWLDYRRGQGHEIDVIEPRGTAVQLRDDVRRAANGGNLRCLVLVGDVAELDRGGTISVPTHHINAKVNARWGSPPTIATDVPFADVDEDGKPDLSIGRIPADTPEELARVIRKIIRYERDSQAGTWQQRLDVVAGIGGFGALADAVIEAAGRQVFMQAVPKHYELRHLSAKNATAATNEFCDTACQNLNEGSLAWIYLGHGLPTELDRVPTSNGLQPILSVSEIARVRCQKSLPLAVLVACYTGAFDANSECLAEELSLTEEGPVAVIAATRVTMPYGNTVFGYELMRACFHDRPASLGESMLLAQQRTIQAQKDDQFRPSLDSLAQGISPPPVDLATERREHVLMYHLFGDPLLRLRLAPSPDPRAAKLQPVIGTAIGK